MSSPVPRSIKIVSDGTINGTGVYNSDGTPIPYVQQCKIDMGLTTGVVTAELTVLCPTLELSGVKVSKESRSLKPVYEIGSAGEPIGLVPDEG